MTAPPAFPLACRPPSRRFTLLGLIALAAPAAGCAGEITGNDDPPDAPDTPDTPDDPVDPDPFEPPPALAELAAADRDALASRLDALFDAPPLSSLQNSAVVVDAETGQVLYERGADTALKPASNTKLLTTAVAMAELGADYRIETRATSHAAVSAGTLEGDLHILGHHDFTWSSRLLPDPELPARELAASLRAAGVDRVAGTVWVRGEYLVEGDNFGSYDAALHRDLAAGAIEGALSAAGIEIGSVRTDSDLAPGEGAAVLARWKAPPLTVGCAPLNKLSHNEFADILSRHVGFSVAGESTYDAWNDALISWLGAAGLPADGVTFSDGSGLSHSNRISARTVAALLRHMLATSEGLPWSRTFAVGNRDGTLGNRLGDPDTSGRFVGKTGTLRDTIALSGILHNRYDGRRYILALLANDVTDASATRAAHDRVVTEVGRDLRGAGGVLPVPELERVAWLGDVVEIEWREVPGADGYLVWPSEDGRTWRREDARFVTGTRYLAGDLDPAAPVFLRVTAWDGVADGAPSDVYPAARAETGDRILLVDGNDRWDTEPAPENHLDIGHDLTAAYGFSLASAGYATVANDLVIDGRVDLLDYDAVFWILGEEGSVNLSFEPEEQAALTEFTDAGGSLFVSGSEIGWDLVEFGGPADIAFYQDVLRADYLEDDAGTYLARASDPSTLGGPDPFHFFHPAALDAAFPDRLAPTGGSVELLTYDTGGAAAIQYDGDYRLIHLAFPAEALAAPEDRDRILTAALAFFEL